MMPARTRAVGDAFIGTTEMARRMRELDWSKTPLGPVERWPQSLRTSVSTCLDCAFPIVLWWGPELTILYNDEYAQMLGAKHPVGARRARRGRLGARSGTSSGRCSRRSWSAAKRRARAISCSTSIAWAIPKRRTSRSPTARSTTRAARSAASSAPSSRPPRRSSASGACARCATSRRSARAPRASRPPTTRRPECSPRTRTTCRSR